MTPIARPPSPATYFAIAAALTLATAPALAQFKCRQPDGSMSYQQTPCAGAQTDARGGGPAPAPTSARTNTSSATRPDAEAQAAQLRLKKEVADAEHRQKVRTAIESRQPMVGMTRQELELAMGPPDKVDFWQSRRGQDDRFEYRRSGRLLWVYLEGNAVHRISNYDDSSASKKTACPTASQIRDLEIEASKFTNRGDERKQAEIAKKLEKARACA